MSGNNRFPLPPFRAGLPEPVFAIAIAIAILIAIAISIAGCG